MALSFDLTHLIQLRVSLAIFSHLLHQEFKHALREDTVDYSHYTANIKRKRPTATPRRVQVRKPVYVAGGYDDGDDDGDYTGGSDMHKISFSGRRSSLRNSRQY